MARFACYTWPGNLRQLATVLRTAALVAHDAAQITAAHLSHDLLEELRRVAGEVVRQQLPSLAPGLGRDHGAVRETLPGHASASLDNTSTPEKTLNELEVETISNVLQACDGNISEASKRLGISRNTIYRKLRWKRAA